MSTIILDSLANIRLLVRVLKSLLEKALCGVLWFDATAALKRSRCPDPALSIFVKVFVINDRTISQGFALKRSIQMWVRHYAFSEKQLNGQ